MKRAKKGFTLVEVIIVLVIIAIVAAIAVPNISGYIKRSKANNCQHTMNDFVNDLEYKIVSKRYYDVSELNDELIKLVDSYADSYSNESPAPDTTNGKFNSLTTVLEKTTGICPNGGQYTVRWVISPGGAENPNTAKVKIQTCECNCMDENEHVKLSNSYELTAALIDTSEYIKSGRSAEELYDEEIKKLVKKYNDIISDPNSYSTPAFVDDIVQTINNDSNNHYKIIGMSVSRDPKINGENNVEWMLVDYEIDYSVESPENVPTHKFFVYYPLENKMESLDITKTQFDDKKSWPPAEGNEGSYLYLDGLDYSNGNTYQVADVKNSHVEWIQRERKWYVQKNDKNKGVDTASVQLKSKDELNSSSAGELFFDSAFSAMDLKNFLTVSVGYSGSSEKESFKHLEVSEDYKFIKNGYVLVRSEEAVSGLNWSGLLSGEDGSSAQVQNLKSILEEEKNIETELQNFIQSGSYSDWGRGNRYMELTVAYQECYKDGNGNYEPHLCFGKVRFYSDNGGSNVRIVPVINGTEGEAIGNISSEDVPGSFDIKYEQSEPGTFRVEDLTVSKNVKYTITDSNGNKTGEFTSPVVLSSNPKSYTEENGFYLSKDGYSGDTGNPTDKTAETVKMINEGTINHGFVVLPTTADHNIRYTPMVKLNLGTVDLDSIKCSYEKGEEEQAFYLDDDHIKVSANFPLEVEEQDYNSNQKYGNVTASVNGIVTVEFEHRTSQEENGWYLAGNQWSGDYNEADETALLEKINNYEASGFISLHQNGSGILSCKNLFEVNSSLKSLSAKYDTSHEADWFTNAFNYILSNSDFSLAYIVAQANYQIIVENQIGQNRSIIYHSEPLNHNEKSEEEDRRYYLAKDNNESKESVLEGNDDSFIEVLSKQTGSIWNRKKYSGNVSVYYADYLSEKIVNASFNLDLNNKNSDASTVDVNEFVFEKDGNTLKMKGYLGSDIDVVIPSRVEGYWTTTADNSLFSANIGDTTYYYINDENYYNVTEIGDGTNPFYFEKPSGLKSITIEAPSSTAPDMTIKASAFMDLNLESIVLPTNKLTAIEENAFNNVNLSGSHFVVPEGVNSISDNAFDNFNISGGTLLIEGSTSVAEEGNIVEKNKFNNSLFKNLSFGSKVKKVDEEAFKGNKSPASIDLGSVSEIGDSAFYGWKKATGDLVIPKSMKVIGENAFSGYASEISDKNSYPSLTIYGGSVLDGTGIGTSIFNASHIRNVTIGGNVNSVSESAFDNTSGEYNDFTGSLTLQNTIGFIGGSAFENCKGFDGILTIPDNQRLKTIYAETFSGCSGFTGDLVIPSNVIKIENKAFENCSSLNGTLTLGNRLNAIGGEAFSGLSSVTGDLVIPDSVTYMGNKAFDSFAVNCSKTEEYPSLTINGGSNGSSLGSMIFANSKFNNITIGGNVKKIDALAFKNGGGQSDKNYNYLCGKLEISNSVEVIGKAAFKDCTGLTGTLDLQNVNQLKEIGDAAFEGCLGFKGDLKLPDSVVTVGSRSFEGCVGFNGNLNLGNGLKKIGMEAFDNCTGFTGGLTIPQSVTGSIGNCAFRNFGSEGSGPGKLVINAGSYSEGKKLGAFIFNGSKFNGISIGGIVEEISVNAFHHDNTVDDLKAVDDSKVESYVEDEIKELPVVEQTMKADYSKITGNLYIGSSVKVIDNSAFQEMSIEGLTGMESVQRIGRYAFWKCDKIASDITFENNTSLERIEREAFYGTTSLGSLTIPPTVTFMGPYAFDNSGSGNGRLVIFGASRIEDGKKYLGDNKYSGQPDTGGTLFNHARYRDVIIGGNVDVIGQYFMKSDFSRTDGSYNTNFDHHGITGNLTITGNVSEIEGEAFNDAGFDGTLTLNSSKLETIGYSAFENLPNMHGDLVIPQTVHNIDRRAFKKFAMNASDSKLGTLSIKGYSETNGNQHIIGYRLFSFARFKSVEIGGENSSVNTIGNFAFYNSSLATDSTMEDNQTVYEVFDSGSGYTDEDIKVYRNLKYDERNEGVKVNNDNSNFSRFTPELKILDGIETIGTRAFGDNHSILKVTFESSVLKTIGKDAFNRCTNAGGGLTIPKTVSSIGRCAFKQYGENTDNPGTLTILGYSDSVNGLNYIGIPLNDLNSDPKPIFPSAKFKDVVIGGTEEEATVNAIGDKFMNNIDPTNKTYNYSGMTGSLTIGKSIKSVGREAFVLCTGFNGALTLNENLQTIGHDAFNACNNFHGDLTIPSTVTSIGSYAFKHFGQGMITSGDNTGSLTILGYSSEKGGLKTIDKDIFNHGHFTNVTIGGNVQSVADDFMNNQYTDNFGYGDVHRFEYVKGKLTIGNSVQKIGKTSFLLCEGFDGPLTLNENLVSIGESAFNACISFHGDLLIPSTVSSIGKDAFKHFGQGGMYGSNDNQGSLTVLGYSSTNNDGLRTIDKDIFNHAHFTNVTVGGELNGHKATVQCIADDFMENNSLENFNGNNVHKYSNVRGNLTIGAGVEKIGSQAFWNCNGFTGKLEIADTVKYIGQSAFSGLYELYTNVSDKNERILKIPSSVEYMGPYAFKALSAKMDEITKDTNMNEYTGEKDTDMYPAVEIYGSSGPDGILGDNKAIFSKARINGLKIGGSVVSIADEFMCNDRYATPDTRYVNKAEDESEDHLYSYIYGDLIIEGSVKHIGKKAFYYFQHFDENDRNKHMRGNFVLSEGLETIGEEAFAQYRPYSTVTAGNRHLVIPSTVTEIGRNAFNGFCHNYDYPPDLTILGYSIYDGSKDLGKEIIGEEIFDYAWFNNVTIGGKVKRISNMFMCTTGDSSRNGAYDHITGTLTILPRTVGYSNYFQRYFPDSMLQGTINNNQQYGSFFDANFDKVRLPKALYDEFENRQWQVFGQYNLQPNNPSLGFTYEVISE